MYIQEKFVIGSSNELPSTWIHYNKVAEILSTSIINIDRKLEDSLVFFAASASGNVVERAAPSTHKSGCLFQTDDCLGSFGKTMKKISRTKRSRKVNSDIEESNRIARETAQSIKVISEAALERNKILRKIAFNQKKLMAIIASQNALIN